MRFIQGHRDHHALACRQSVRLDHDRCAMFINVGMSCRHIAERLVERGGNIVPHHEGLGEILGGLQLRGSFGRAEDFQICAAERIDHPFGQRRFGAYHGEINTLFLCKRQQFVNLADCDVFHAVFQCRAGIAGGDIHLLHAGGLRQTPRQRVLTTTGTDN